MIDKDEILSRIIQLVEAHEILRQSDLELKLLGEFPHTETSTILTAISTAAQDGLVKKFEISIGRGKYRYIYAPITARII